MADFLDAKSPVETVERRWTPAVEPLTVSQSASGVTVSSAEIDGGDVVFLLAGGTAGQTATITAAVATRDGETLVETLYVPVVAGPAQIAATARDFVSFALRKVTGPRRAPSDSEMDDALERLNALVARMRAGGADIGAPFPLLAESVVYCPDWAVSALRYNLLIDCVGLYGLEPTAYEYDAARRGMQLVKHKGLPAVREAEFF